MPSDQLTIELAERDAALDAMEERHTSYLDVVRFRMKSLYNYRVARHGIDHAYVTADDARREFEALHPPKEVNRNCLGSVWRGKEWEATGQWKKSKTKGRHGNRVQCWRLRT